MLGADAKVTSWRDYDANLCQHGRPAPLCAKRRGLILASVLNGITCSIGGRHSTAAIIVPPRSTTGPGSARMA